MLHGGFAVTLSTVSQAYENYESGNQSFQLVNHEVPIPLAAF